MAARTKRARILVLGKRKLGESDVIVTMLTEAGSTVSAVAKSARKPGGTFASRLEYFSEADVLIAEGKSLGIVQEARIVNAHAAIRTDLERSLCAMPIAELLSKTLDEGLENPRLFDLAKTLFVELEQANPASSLALCSAALLKTMSYIGFRPSLTTCVHCGEEVHLDDGRSIAYFSFTDGGTTCDRCHDSIESIAIEPSTIAWIHHFLYSTFASLDEESIDEGVSAAVLQFARQWVIMHAGVHLKSLDYLMTSGVFASGETL